MPAPIRLTVWAENVHEKQSEAVLKVYPDGIHRALARAFENAPGIEVRTAELGEPEHGLSAEVLAETDVLMWWGHREHRTVDDAVVERVRERVLSGMGFIALHSSHFSKPFRALMGTNGSLKWREIGERQRVWVVEPSHPIAEALGEFFELPQSEMYGERFDVPPPDELVFISWFQGGEVFRSGCVWRRGHGKVFYFQPGHETYPIYHDPNVLTALLNAVRYLRPTVNQPTDACRRAEPLEEV